MTIAEIGIASCAVCQEPTELVEYIGGGPCCATCAPLLRRALADGGSILRWRCTGVLASGPRACGRVWRVAYQPERLDEIVADTSSACPACRPAQRAFVERLAGHRIEWEDDANA